MSQFTIERFPPKNPTLKTLIKYFWVMRSENDVKINHKLLPVTNVDIVLNLSNTMTYRGEFGETKAPPYSFTSIKNQYRILNQAGRLNSFGISFYPAGLFPFIKKPLEEFGDQTIDLATAASEFCTRLEYGLNPERDSIAQTNQIEKIVENFIDPQMIPNRQTNEIFATFTATIGKSNINEYCQKYGVNPRKLQRMFRKYCGINPIVYKRIKRFQRVVHYLIKNRPNDLTSIAYDYGYYDQAHFINDFKIFSGSTPSLFLKDKKSLKQHLIYK